MESFRAHCQANFILRYINDVTLHQAIERQLNKIESSHRMSRAISIDGGHEIYQGDKQAQEVDEGCKRLIKNPFILELPVPSSETRRTKGPAKTANLAKVNYCGLRGCLAVL